jgi:hypothetical protein
MKTYKEIVREVFTFQLTPTELVAKGEEAANLNKAIQNKEHALAVFRKERKAEIDSLRGDLNHVLRVVEAKSEDREIECAKVYDFEVKKVSFIYKGEILKERNMEERETQLQFDTVKMHSQETPAQPQPQQTSPSV